MNDILNFFQSTERIGTAGQPTAEQFRDIADAGYAAVINIAMHDSEGAIPEEGNIVASLGMDYVHIPVPFDAPSAEHLRRFFGAMNTLEGEKVFVHCALNMRVSVFMYKYLTLVEGRAPVDSESPILAGWRNNMDEAWQGILDLTAQEID